jgi:hypothetical protein
MLLEFLKTYKYTVNLDDKQYDHRFPQGVKRSDFLLFGKQIVCEVKGIENIKIPSKVEKLSRKGSLSHQNFKRDLYNSINEALSSASKQIGDTKNALNCHGAYGLVILENLIPENLSILSLLDAADRKMASGLVNVDATLCVDFVNSFVGPDSNQVQPAQIAVRDVEKTQRLYSLVEKLLADFCQQSGAPFYRGFDIADAYQRWLVNQEGKYSKYKAKVDFNLPVSGDKPGEGSNKPTK